MSAPNKQNFFRALRELRKNTMYAQCIVHRSHLGPDFRHNKGDCLNTFFKRKKSLKRVPTLDVSTMPDVVFFVITFTLRTFPEAPSSKRCALRRCGLCCLMPGALCARCTPLTARHAAYSTTSPCLLRLSLTSGKKAKSNLPDPKFRRNVVITPDLAARILTFLIK